jgi:hypothetical protein
MSKRRNRGAAVNNISGLDDWSSENDEAENNETPTVPPLQNLTATEGANLLYDSQVADQPLQKPLRASPTPIERIHPDPAQPRRTVPYEIRSKHWVNASPDFESMAHLFDMWMKEVQHERDGEAINIEAYLEGTVTERAPADLPEDAGDDTAENNTIARYITPYSNLNRKLGAIEYALLQVIDLAANIRKHSLMNPITIAPHPAGYMLETGERRWLAYHLLHWYEMTRGTGSTEYANIHARRVDRVDIWRQASENNARNDLNGIGKARQLARLLMDLYEARNRRFKPYDAFEADRLFYAQVDDGSVYRVPHGQAERVVNAMGFKNAVQIRQYRRLLRLPDVVWNLADDLNWSQNAIDKDILQPARDEEDVIRRALRIARRDGYPVSALTEYAELIDLHEEDTAIANQPSIADVAKSKQDKAAKERGSLGKFGLLVDRYRVGALEREFAKLGPSEREKVLAYFDNLTRALERRQQQLFDEDA